jgi:TPR repeat protein
MMEQALPESTPRPMIECFGPIGRGRGYGFVTTQRPSPISVSTINWDDEPDLDRFRRARAAQRIDPRRGLQVLEELAELGSIASIIHTGFAYQRGNGVSKDLERAEYWYRRATDAGSLEGSFRLGGLCRTCGQFDEALAAYSIGASQEFPASLYWMGRMYFNGMGVGPDAEKAIQLWQQASAKGHPYAARNLAFARLNGRYGVGGVFRGVAMWLSAMRKGAAIIFRNPQSDLLR